METEKRIIPEFAELGYCASADGHIYSATGHMLAEHIQANGYVCTTISDYGKPRCRGVAKMVAAAWLGEAPMFCRVTHIDGDSTNNSIENLKYETRRKNG